jgi:hypothetical protein
MMDVKEEQGGGQYRSPSNAYMAARYHFNFWEERGGLEHLEHLEHSWIRFETAGSPIFGIYTFIVLLLFYFLEGERLNR